MGFKRGKKGTSALTSLLMNKNLSKSKRAQVTIFIIIAIVIFVLGLLAYLFFPEIKSTLGKGVKNPQAFIQECMEDEIKDAVEIVSLQGGSIEPEFYILYNNAKVKYLCYTRRDHMRCDIKQPILIRHIEEEIKKEIDDKVRTCFNLLEKSYRKKDYEVNLQEGSVPVKVELLPERIVSTFDYSLTLTKGETEQYDSFDVVLNNNLYELVTIASSIIRLEYEVGNIEPTAYMGPPYPSYVKVEREPKIDGTKIYILTDKRSGDKFQFASRSLVSPEGL